MKASTLPKMAGLLLGFLWSWVRSRNDLALENLALRQQLATFKQEQPRPRLSKADRAFWVLLRGLWSKWSNALIIVSPDTVVRWHRQGFRRYWDALSRRGRKPGRPRKDLEIRELIRKMAAENPTWGAPRIHAELLKLGFKVAERTVSRYLPKRPSNPDKIKLWKAFLKNHRDEIAAMDFFIIPMLTFKLLYALVIIHHGRRVLLYVNVTFNPTAQWVIQQLREAFPYDAAPKRLIFDRDSIFCPQVVAAVKTFGIKPVRTTWRCPWQNGVVERWVGSCRGELLDHVVVLSERHAMRLLREYIAYYDGDRCHLTLGKDAPKSRPVQARPAKAARVRRGLTQGRWSASSLRVAGSGLKAAESSGYPTSCVNVAQRRYAHDPDSSTPVRLAARFCCRPSLSFPLIQLSKSGFYDPIGH